MRGCWKTSKGELWITRTDVRCLGKPPRQQALARLARLSIDLEKITEKLLADGITAFTHSLDELQSFSAVETAWRREVNSNS
jgi:hypothetical protein